MNNEKKDDELYHFGRRGMRWGQHIFGELKSNVGYLTGQAKKGWDSLDSSDLDNLKRTMYNNRTVRKAGRLYDEFATNTKDLVYGAKSKWDSLDDTDLLNLQYSGKNFIENIGNSKIGDTYRDLTGRYSESKKREIQAYINANIQRSTTTVSNDGEFEYNKNSRTIDTSPHRFKGNESIINQYLRDAYYESGRSQDYRNSAKDYSDLANKYGSGTRYNNHYNNKSTEYSNKAYENDKVVNDYINKAITSGSVASALGVGEYSTHPSTTQRSVNRWLNSTSENSILREPYQYMSSTNTTKVLNKNNYDKYKHIT